MLLSERWWRRIRALAERRIRSHYMDRMRHDRRCPNCGTWGALGAGFDWSKLRIVPEQPRLDTLPCLQCGHVGKWDNVGMVPTPASTEIIRHKDVT